MPFSSKLRRQVEKCSAHLSDDELAAMLSDYADAYYNTDTPLVDDDTFDALEDLLRERDPKHMFFAQIGAPVRAGTDAVDLPFFMPSLDKITTDEADPSRVKKLLKAYKKQFEDTDTSKQRFVVSVKLDGVSGLLYKNRKGKFKLYTRGDGAHGQDITHLLKFLVSPKVQAAIPNDTAIRGEIIMSKVKFEQIRDGKNIIARNLVSGVVTSKTVDIQKAKRLDFVTYQIISPDTMTVQEQFEALHSYGLLTAYYDVMTYDDLTVKELTKEFHRSREEDIYPADGVVIVDNSRPYPVPTNLEYPAYARAFKTLAKDQEGVTTVIKIRWKTSKNGLIKPTILVETLQLPGVDIRRATAFNAAFVVEHQLGPGAIVSIKRSGDVIPKITKVLEPSPEGPQLPEGKEGRDWTWTPSHVDIKLLDVDTDDVKIQEIVHFFKELKVKGISEGVVTKLVESGLDTIFAILKAPQERITNIPGLGMSAYTKLHDGLDAALKNVSLAQLITSTHTLGTGVGKRKVDVILAMYPNFIHEDWIRDPRRLREHLMRVEGFGEKMTASVVAGMENMLKFLRKLGKLVDLEPILHPDETVRGGGDDDHDGGRSDDGDIGAGPSSNAAADTSTCDQYVQGRVVLTGFRDEAISKYVKACGGQTADNVSGNTTLVIYNDKGFGTGKFTKAEQLIAKGQKLKLMSQAEFTERYLG